MSPPIYAVRGGPVPVDIAVVGSGPAGSAIANRAAVRGLTVAMIDPAYGAPWPATYGIWDDEIPDWLGSDVTLATMQNPVAIARQPHRIERSYSMLSTARLQAALQQDDDAITRRTLPAVGVRRSHGSAVVILQGGNEVAARVVIDCSGPRRVLTGGPARGARAEQTAFGLMVHDQDGITQAFMDWRDDHGEDGWPSFLYAVPMGRADDGTPLVLLEETALARRPALDVEVLRRRLYQRLAARGLSVRDDAPAERVRFVVDTPPTAGVGHTVAFGAAAPLLHPASGYSLGTSLGLADDLVDAVQRLLPDGVAAARAARQVVWPRSARAVHHLRRRGLEAVLDMDPEGIVDFFDVYFSLPAAAQRIYMSGRRDVPALMGVMWQIFQRADNRLRRHLWRWGLAPMGDHVADDVSPSWA